MVQVNDVVLYGIDGICRVADITVRPIRGQPSTYYVLKSLCPENTTIYVPACNETLVSRMQKLMSSDEAMELIRSIPEEETLWIDDELRRRSVYERILEGGDRRKIVAMIKTLYERREALRQRNRKMHSADERLLREAERRLYGEFAHVLRLEPEQVPPFIAGMIGARLPDGGARAGKNDRERKI